ncbi:hypothetical protein SACS_0709 [Parasaccharibacter apium]|uniref:Uncharacterized protein n=1 Tax=Parasaccharibacter apium TaxID=1510841 RepID=A0A7U7G5B9_9PROT|nr:hypothetical protein SACS_0709 [Parasaccharibacter apium]
MSGALALPGAKGCPATFSPGRKTVMGGGCARQYCSEFSFYSA